MIRMSVSIAPDSSVLVGTSERTLMVGERRSGPRFHHTVSFR
jgi:hypothetical protein